MSAQELPLQDIGLFVTPVVATYINLYADIKAEQAGLESGMPLEIKMTLDATGSAENLVKTQFELLDQNGYTNTSIADDAMDELGIEHIYCNCFSGNVSTMDTSAANQINEDYEDSFIVYVQTSKGPSVFNTGYNNIDEIIAEFRETFKDILPEDFDYKSAICEIDGTDFS